MKKMLLSCGVIGVFIVYALHQKEESDSVHVVAPQNLQTNNSQPSNTPTPSTSSAPDFTNPTGTPVIQGSKPPVSSATATPTAIPTPTKTQGQYKDGEYTGNTADAFYGNIQVKAIIQGGKITDVQFLQYPNDRSTSIMINQQAMPYLKQEAIQAQSAQVDIVSGATDSSQAFQQSLQSALSQAKS